MKHFNTKSIVFSLLFLLVSITVNAQVQYQPKVEVGYMNYRSRTLLVNPGPNWRGYYLNENQNGMDVSVINGFSIQEKYFVGVGLGYLNFEGINGYSIYADADYIPMKTKLAPLVNFKVGYNHIYNQYEGGTGSALGELGVGLRYRMAKQRQLYIQTGFLGTQQANFNTCRLGVQF